MKICNRTAVIWFCLFVFISGSASSAEEEKPEPTLNFAYATVLGTGAYTVGESSVYILNMPLSTVLREPVREDWGIELLLPVTLGVHNFEVGDILINGFPEQVGTFGFSPGVKIDIPMNDHWTVKPYGHLGYAADLSEGNDAWTYIGGVESLSTYPMDKLTVSLGGSATVAGQTAVSGDDSSGFGMLSLGVDVRHPIGIRLQEKVLDGSLYFIASRYFNQLEFLEIGDEDIDVEYTLEIGMTLGTRSPLKVFGVDLQRVGMGFVYGDELLALSFNLGFPF